MELYTRVGKPVIVYQIIIIIIIIINPKKQSDFFLLILTTYLIAYFTCDVTLFIAPMLNAFPVSILHKQLNIKDNQYEKKNEEKWISID